MAAYRSLFTSTGLILRNIMKTDPYSYTITIKQIVRFQERMHLEKFQGDKIQNGRLSAIIYLDRPDIAEYHENCSRYLHHYYKTNCKVSGEDTFWKKSTRPSSKWPPIGHHSLSHGRYLVNRARWLDYYYKNKMCDFRRGCILKKFDLIKFKMAAYRPLFIFTWPIFGKPC